MTSRLSPGLRSILNVPEPEEPACTTCQDLLHAYVDAELDGHDANALFPAVAEHLEHCPGCRQAYEEIKVLFMLEREGRLVEPTSRPPFDFSFLERARQPEPVWQPVESAGGQVLRLFTEIRAYIAKESVRFGSLPHPLALVPLRPMPTRKGAPQGGEPVQALQVPTPEHDLSVLFILSAFAADEAELIVEASRLSPPRPLARAWITLRDEQAQVLDRVLSRDDGQATFANLKLGSYVVEIGYEGSTWQYPIRLAHA